MNREGDIVLAYIWLITATGNAILFFVWYRHAMLLSILYLVCTIMQLYLAEGRGGFVWRLLAWAHTQIFFHKQVRLRREKYDMLKFKAKKLGMREASFEKETFEVVK